MSTDKKHCVWCGQELEWPVGYGETPCCGDPECERELAAEERQRAEEAAWDAYDRETG